MPRPATWTRPPRPLAEKERRERYQGRGSAGGRCTGAATTRSLPVVLAVVLVFVAALLALAAAALALLAGVSSWAGWWGAACWGALVVNEAGVASAVPVGRMGASDTRVSCGSSVPSSVSVAAASCSEGAPTSSRALSVSSNDGVDISASASAIDWAGVCEVAMCMAACSPVCSAACSAAAVTSASSWLSEPCRFSRGSFDMPPLFQDRATCVAMARGSEWGGVAEKSSWMWLASLEVWRYATKRLNLSKNRQVSGFECSLLCSRPGCSFE